MYFRRAKKHVKYTILVFIVLVWESKHPGHGFILIVSNSLPIFGPGMHGFEIWLNSGFRDFTEIENK